MLRSGAGELGLDDELVRRNVKMRLFDRETPVQVGRYPIERRIGHGGMGAVYEATDPELGRKVAIKIMLPGRNHADRTLAEARALAKLSHPNVVTIHEVGSHKERVFLAMEYVHGQTLAAWLERSRPQSEVLELFEQAARGLHAAHGAGLVHRDFKPSNVLVGDDGRVQVIDFGLSKLAASTELDDGDPSRSDDDGLVGMTQTGQLLGTPAYMAPEQFAGNPIDARTDIFAFAVVLYEALGGRRPFEGDDPTSLARELCTPGPSPARLRGVSSRLWRTLRAALERDPDHRPESLEPMLAALRPGSSKRIWLSLGAAALLAGGTATAARLYDGATDESASGDPVGALVQSNGTQGGTAERTAFEAMLDRADTSQRVASAVAFLETVDNPPPEHELIALAWIGLDGWNASCDAPRHGLCAKVVPREIPKMQCPSAAPLFLSPIDRNQDLARPAAKRLLDARRLAQRATRPSEPTQRRHYDEAMANTVIALADAEFETLLGTRPPKELIFEGKAEALSTQAFQTYFKLKAEGIKSLTAKYALVKGQPASTLVAASRTALATESIAWGLYDIELPAEAQTFPRRGKMFCDILDARLAPTLKVAADARAYCQANVTRSGVPPELASVCEPLALPPAE